MKEKRAIIEVKLFGGTHEDPSIGEPTDEEAVYDESTWEDIAESIEEHLLEAGYYSEATVRYRRSTHSVYWVKAIYSVYWVEEDTDYNAIVRASTKKEAIDQIRSLVGIKPKSAHVMDEEELKDFDITAANIREMDRDGYYIYDSGT